MDKSFLEKGKAANELAFVNKNLELLVNMKEHRSLNTGMKKWKPEHYDCSAKQTVIWYNST